ncbi:MAG: class I SAM-dependent methyltransferase [Elusimicrobia bacterium]|nr:class I SAM-dependent methyltransferase [Elusimicrobiota bacterium]
MTPDEMKLSEAACLCGSREHKTLYERPYPRVFVPEDFNATTDRFDAYGRIVRCSSCRLVFTNPRPDDAFITEGYAASADDQYADEAPSRAINAHLCLATIRRFIREGRLLEVGCAAGYFLNAARSDFDVEGVEPSRWAAESAARRFGVAVHAATLPEARLAAEGYDVVVLVDVIEHLTDPVGALAECRRLLKPGGWLYLVTPDIDSLSAKVLRGSWWGLRPAHFYYFSPKTLSALLEKAGFETALCRSYGRMFTLDYWSSRLKNYPALVRVFVERTISTMQVRDKFVYINTRDSFELVARKT